MHNWGDENVDWQGIDDAGAYIGYWLRRWMRMDVRQVKEKFGTVRVYCSLGWSQFYSIFYPGYCWIKPWWPSKLDNWLSYHTPVMSWINRIVIPVHRWAYAWRYKRAVQKWPHLYNEIVSCADWGELFDGVVPGYKHSDYWRTYENSDTTN